MNLSMQMTLQKRFGDILKCSGETGDILSSLNAEKASTFSALFPYNKRDRQLSKNRPNKVTGYICIIHMHAHTFQFYNL